MLQVLLQAGRFFACSVIVCAVAVARAQTILDPHLAIQEVVPPGSVSGPIGMTFLGSNANDFFVLEKHSGVVKRFLNGVSSTALDLNVANNNERGLLGVALHPNFGIAEAANSDKVYLHYSLSSTESDGSLLAQNQLSRFTWNGTSLENEEVLAVFGVPTPAEQGNFLHHNGGPLRFGPDGKIYGIVGDFDRNGAEQNNLAAANSSARVGGVFRLNDDGSIPADNPFITNSNADFHRWFAYGIRNSFGMSFDSQTGKLWDTENGLFTYDEINVVAPGFNSGWRTLMGPQGRSNLQIPNDLLMLEGAHYSDPEFSYGVTVAPTAIQFLAGSAFGPAFDNKVFVGTFSSSAIHMLTLNENRDGFALDGPLSDLVADWSPNPADNELELLRVVGNISSITDFTMGPDGFIYAVGLFNNKIYRIVPRLLLGDYNRDYHFDELDIVAMLKALCDLEAYRTEIGFSQEELVEMGDMNGDLAVTNLDIQALINRLTEPHELEIVPEPTTAVLMLLGSCTFALATWRKRLHAQRR